MKSCKKCINIGLADDSLSGCCDIEEQVSGESVILYVDFKWIAKQCNFYEEDTNVQHKEKSNRAP